MPTELLIPLCFAIFFIAILYSSVGHAGASGYIAVMSLLSLAPEIIKPTALVLNIVVASITTYQFWRAGHFSWALFWPFALLATPMAFLGGYLALPVTVFKVLVGVVLLFSALRFLMHPMSDDVKNAPPRAAAFTSGGLLGLLAGLTGTGGGIFLTPLLLHMRWAHAKQAAAVSAAFILLNSSAGLLGNYSSAAHIPLYAIGLAIAAVLGGVIGSHVGSRRLPHQRIKRLLALILAIAGLKLIFS